MKTRPLITVTFPATIVIDTRENRPFEFIGIRSDARDGGGPLAVTLRRGTLPTGDYSIEGLENIVACERKSAADLFSTIGQSRERFERELARLNQMKFAAVVVEAPWGEIIESPPPHSQLPPKIVFRSVIAWQQRYPRCHWWFCHDRDMAEVTTLRILERAWKEVKEIGKGEDRPAGDCLMVSNALRLLRLTREAKDSPRPQDRRAARGQMADIAAWLARAVVREAGGAEVVEELAD